MSADLIHGELPAVREFQEWLNDQRMKDVSQVFHEIVTRYRKAIEETHMMAPATRIGQHTVDFAKRAGWNPDDGEGAFEYVQRVSYAQGLEDAALAGWKEAAIAWNVCASVHEQYAKGRDALFTTRQADYQKHHQDASKRATRDPEHE